MNGASELLPKPDEVVLAPENPQVSAAVPASPPPARRIDRFLSFMALDAHTFAQHLAEKWFHLLEASLILGAIIFMAERTKAPLKQMLYGIAASSGALLGVSICLTLQRRLLPYLVSRKLIRYHLWMSGVVLFGTCVMFIVMVLAVVAAFVQLN